MAERILFDHEFVLITQGTGAIIYRTERIEFAPHDLLFIPPFRPHRFEAGPCEHLAVHFDFAPGVPALGRTLARRRPYEVRFPENRQLTRRTTLVKQDRVEREFAALVTAWQDGGSVGELEAGAALLGILATLFRRTEDKADERGRVRIERAVTMLAEPTRTVPVTALARACRLSVSHFNREFREWTGYSPVEYQRRQRVARARVLLAEGRLSIKEVAAAVGFDDQYHFSRVFRQLDGLSPSQYRAAAMSGSSIR
jgi:AraC-like DNA-binding protein